MATYDTLTDLATGGRPSVADWDALVGNLGYLAAGQLPDESYSSGWFSVSASNTYNKAHGLGQTPAVVVLEHAAVASPGPTDEIVRVSHVTIGGNDSVSPLGYDDTDIIVSSGTDGGEETSNSTRRRANTGYWRVRAWTVAAFTALAARAVGQMPPASDWDTLETAVSALNGSNLPAPGFDSGWFAVADGNTYQKPHNLEVVPGFAIVEHAAVASPSGSDELVLVTSARISGSQQQSVLGYDGTDCFAQTPVNATAGTVYSTRRQSDAGYYRIRAWPLGEYDTLASLAKGDLVTVNEWATIDLAADLLADGMLPEPPYDSGVFAVSGASANIYTKPHSLGASPALVLLEHLDAPVPDADDERVPPTMVADYSDDNQVDVLGWNETNIIVETGDSGGDSTVHASRRTSASGYYRLMAWKL